VGVEHNIERTTNQPNGNFHLRLIRQNALNPLEELPYDPGQHLTSRQLSGRGVDEMRDGGEGVEDLVIPYGR